MSFHDLFTPLLKFIFLHSKTHWTLNSSQTETTVCDRKNCLEHSSFLSQRNEIGGNSVFLLAKLEVTHCQCSPRYKGRSKSVICSIVSDPLWPCGLQPSRLLCPWDSLGKNTGVGCHSLLQGIIPTQGSNLDLPH